MVEHVDSTPEATTETAVVNRTPPYISFSTFQTFLGDMKAHGIPPQIDRSVLNRFSGGVQGQLIIALRAMGLLTEASAPTSELRELVNAYETASFNDKLQSLLKRTYPYVFALDLNTATPSMFAKSFSDNLNAKEDVLRKCRTFFLHAAKEAGIPLGPRIETAKFPRARSNGGKKTAAKPASSKPTTSEAPPSPLGNVPAGHISEKALEYRLVDLMGDALGDEEVMSAIIKVITFLKTKGARPMVATGPEEPKEGAS